MLVSVHNGGFVWEVLKTHQAGQGEVHTIVVSMFQIWFFINYQFASRPIPTINNPRIKSRIVVKGRAIKNFTEKSTQTAVSLLSVMDKGSEGGARIGLTGI
jgi:hypothetical protein